MIAIRQAFLTSFQFSLGLIESVVPVHASSVFPVSIQSTVPFIWMAAIDVIAGCVEMIAVIGLVEATLWYKNGICKTALRKGSKMESVDVA